MNILIVEDEAISAKGLEQSLTKLDHNYKIVGKTASVAKTVDFLNSHPQPDIIFMDIHLEDDICFEIFRQCNVESPVIFTTAYDQYAIEAFNTNGIAYLLKPYTDEELADAIGKLKRLLAIGQRNAIEKSMTALQPQKKPQRLTFRIGDSYTSVLTDDIAYLLSEDHYTTLVTTSNKQLIINPSLADMETQLDEEKFFRISRSFIININSIEKVSHYFNGRLKLTIRPKPNEDVFVSRQRVKDFLEWYGVI